MVVMPCWQGDDPRDRMVERLVEVLLGIGRAVAGDPEADLRAYSAAASQRLAEQAAAAAAAATAAAADGAGAAQVTEASGLQ